MSESEDVTDWRAVRPGVWTRPTPDPQQARSLMDERLSMPEWTPAERDYWLDVEDSEFSDDEPSKP